MLGVNELRDVAAAVDPFAWTYRRSMKKYLVVLESMGMPDPLQLRYREPLNDAVGRVVRDREPLRAVMQGLGLTADGAPGFETLLVDELRKLEAFHCARYRLTAQATEAWIASGRPQ